MEKRERFVRDALSERYTMSELCARYGVSRRVGYVWPGEVHSCQCIGDEHHMQLDVHLSPRFIQRTSNTSHGVTPAL